MQEEMNFLRLALEQAKQGQGFCAPNPAVGAVIVRAGQVIASGYHQGPGTDHAEVSALKACAETRSATLYVTLEPCCHRGHTPPCTDAIIAAGINKVVFGFYDPLRHSDQQGEAVLRAAGIECVHELLPEIDDFYRYYAFWAKTKRPWLSAKLAMSRNKKIALADGRPVPITGDALREITHLCRLRADAILTTVTTIAYDNPLLNVRLNDEVIKKPLIILDCNCRLPLDAKIFTTAERVLLFHRPDVDSQQKQLLEEKGVTCLSAPYESGFDLMTVMMLLGEQGFHQIWMEAGAKILDAFVHADLTNEVIIYQSEHDLPEDAKPAFLDEAAFFNALLCVEEDVVDGEKILIYRLKSAVIQS